MKFKKGMFGYPKDQVEALLAGLKEEQDREEESLGEEIAAITEEISTLEKRLRELQESRREREEQLKAIENQLAEQFFASVQTVHSSWAEAKKKRELLEAEKEHRQKEMERVDTLIARLCKQLDELSAGFDLAIEGEEHEQL